ncbi:hypothetical protein LTR08_004453 [Meristemomyces frigidus]|nr:hypothetical protein LTR08_004453 [Meristemomyces frigidus]
MPPKRGNRGGSRGARGSTSRGRGSATRGRPTPTTATTHAGIQKHSLYPKNRPLQPRIAAALASAALPSPTTTPTPPTTTTPPSPPSHPPLVPRLLTPTSLHPTSLFFVAHAALATTANTNTIALNLLDHFLQPAHYLPQLSHGVLPAVCFLLASELTDQRNSADAVARAVEAVAGGLALVGVSGLTVSVGDVGRGVLAVLARRAEIGDCVGVYAQGLEVLAARFWGREGWVGGGCGGEGQSLVAEEEEGLLDLDGCYEPASPVAVAEEDLLDLDVWYEPASPLAAAVAEEEEELLDFDVFGEIEVVT